VSLILTYVVTLIVFTGIDFVWLGYIAQGYYRSQIGHLIADKVNMTGAIAFYAVYALGLMLFAIQPAIFAGGPLKALTTGALFGLFCYATYDLTNLATLKNWSLPLSLLDIAWGAILSGVTAAIATWIAGRF
jgi:uncharacterized membrane protein